MAFRHLIKKLSEIPRSHLILEDLLNMFVVNFGKNTCVTLVVSLSPRTVWRPLHAHGGKTGEHLHLFASLSEDNLQL